MADSSASLPHRPMTRSYSGCWTCRLRRKKCDEKYPVCNACAGLSITCHYDDDKPGWMDGGARQEKMAEQIKRDIRTKNRRIRGNHDSKSKISDHSTTSQEVMLATRSQNYRTDAASLGLDVGVDGVIGMSPLPGHPRAPDSTSLNTASVSLEPGPSCNSVTSNVGQSQSISRYDAFLFTYYLDHVLPLLFPFYRPSAASGGKAWLLEMMISRPVVRQATLCQSSYFFSLQQARDGHTVAWDMALGQTRETFQVLRKALQVIHGSDLIHHLGGAVRIMASIMQVQRFDISLSNFDHCQAHLSAALALFRQLLESSDQGRLAANSGGRFAAMIDALGQTGPAVPAHCRYLPTAEQAAFRFSAALLILDDIVGSTARQEQPALYDMHAELLGLCDGSEPHINLGRVMGCENWVLVQIGEIATLDSWKQRQKREGSLNVVELVRRSEVIKAALDSHLPELQSAGNSATAESMRLFDAFSTNEDSPWTSIADQKRVVTKIWYYAALLYLDIVVSGWQPASSQVRNIVTQILDTMTSELSPPTLLRTVSWPFCVAGCLAEKEKECRFRHLAESLQPVSVFGTVRKALDIMEKVWLGRGLQDAAFRDLAMCFKSQGDLFLLV